MLTAVVRLNTMGRLRPPATNRIRMIVDEIGLRLAAHRVANNYDNIAARLEIAVTTLQKRMRMGYLPSNVGIEEFNHWMAEWVTDLEKATKESILRTPPRVGRSSKTTNDHLPN